MATCQMTDQTELGQHTVTIAVQPFCVLKEGEGSCELRVHL